MTALEQSLKEGAQVLGVGLEPLQLQALEGYINLLFDWNKAMNLTANLSKEQLVSHVLDCLSAAPYIEGGSVLDVGSGAGLPGIVLSICAPRKHYVLLEAREKRVVFLQHVIKKLSLDNVELAHCRLEAYRTEAPFGTILSRAFAPLDRFASLVTPLAGSGTQLLGFLGKITDQQHHALKQWDLHKTVPLSIPGVQGERHLVSLHYTGDIA